MVPAGAAPGRRVRRGNALLWLFAGAILLPAPSVAGAGIVGRDPSPILLGARSQQEAKEELKKWLPRSNGRLLLVSPNDYLPGLLLPLHREGILNELSVVLPSDNAFVRGDVAEMHAFLERAGVAEADRKTFVLDNGSIAGRIEGMAVAVHTLSGLPRQERSGIVAIDTAFLPAVYRNEAKIPMVDLAWKLVLTLRDRRAATDAIVLFDAVGRPDFPLGQGYIFALLKEMLADPGRFAAGLPERWRLLRAADGAFYFSQYGYGVRLLKEYLLLAPGDASGCYKLAMVAIRDLDADMALQWLEKAVDADPVFKRAYAEAAGYVYGKEQFDMAERIIRGGLAKFPKDSLLATNLAGLYLNRGEAMRDAGDPEAAFGYFEEAAGVEGAEPSLRERARSLAKELSGAAPPAQPQ